MREDTIAAIASGMTASGIGIIRISGPDAFEVAEKICRLKNGKKFSKMKSCSVHYGFIYDQEQMIDEALILKMQAPHTYTAENTVEIDCHGGPLVMRKVLSAVLRYGARAADPGEFTKRAFLNGRIDLSEAEAVMSLINASNDYALKSSTATLRGSVKDEITSIRSTLLIHIARIEAALDDPEHLGIDDEENPDGDDVSADEADDSKADAQEVPDISELTPDRMLEHISGKEYRSRLLYDIHNAGKKIKHMLHTYDDGRLIREGIHTVILGKPNTGKSSLLNLLTGSERAIVTDIAGTTRDMLEETVNLNGITLLLIDTAGIRATEDEIEKIGVKKARACGEDADLILYVADSSVPLDDNDEELLGFITGRRAVVLLNKSDLPPVVTMEMLQEKTDAPVLSFSAKEGKGLKELSDVISRMYETGRISYNEEVCITNERQRKALTDALESLTLVEKSVEEGLPEDFYSIDLTDAYTSLGNILGEEVGEDVINEIFSKFCMGK